MEELPIDEFIAVMRELYPAEFEQAVRVTRMTSRLKARVVELEQPPAKPKRRTRKAEVTPEPEE